MLKTRGSIPTRTYTREEEKKYVEKQKLASHFTSYKSNIIDQNPDYSFAMPMFSAFFCSLKVFIVFYSLKSLQFSGPWWSKQKPFNENKQKGTGKANIKGKENGRVTKRMKEIKVRILLKHSVWVFFPFVHNFHSLPFARPSSLCYE